MRFNLALVIVAACGGGNPAGSDAQGIADAPRMIDARAIDAHVVHDAPFGHDAPDVVLIDAGSNQLPDANLQCDVLAQTGCAAGDKCTWIEDATTPSPLGHIGCAPAGVVALGGACTYGAPGATGYDNCVGGDVCQSGKCKTICDQNGGTPACGATFTCSVYDGLFGQIGQAAAAGVCNPVCSPLDDNDFLASGSRPGTTCASGEGCYGYPNTAQPSSYDCVAEVNTTLVHRSACTTANGCADASSDPYLNGCAQGYIPLLDDNNYGSIQVDCIAMCKPGNTYSGNPGTQYPGGQSPHTCTTTDARGTFNVASATNNGDQCMFSWLFEVDPDTDMLVRSATSDTLGFCIDHSKYKYDSNNDGIIDSTDANWPLCSSLPLTAASGPQAGDFGCVDSITAGFFLGKPHYHSLRLPYHPIARF